MSEHIPAWKRIGLKVKEELSADPLAVATHLDTASLSTKQSKKLQKRPRSSGTDSKEKKPPKRQKLPKGERAPPPEKDQLAYLRQYAEDRENWKFSKQKQNWILKHVKVIEDKYEPFLVEYFEGLQGGSKDRMVETLRGVVLAWNKLQEETPAAVEKGESEEKEEKEETEEKETKKEAPQKKDEHDELTSVDADFATRAKKLLAVMIDEEFVLKGIDDVEKPEKAEETQEKQAQLSEELADSEEGSSGESSESKASSSESVDEPEESEKETAVEEPVTTEETPEPKKEKKDKKDKKNKKKYKNLSIEQVEATEWVSPSDYVDGAPTVDSSEAPKTGKKTKKSKSKSKSKSKEKKEKKSKSDE